MKHLVWSSIISLWLISCVPDSKDNGLIIKESPYSVDVTYDKLRTLISKNANLKILLELDHSKNAANAGLQLKPTRILLFGNPKLGTPLMQESATTSIDLPQKIIVYTEDGKNTKIAYNNPSYLKQRHDIIGQDAILDKISNALNNITNKTIE